MNINEIIRNRRAIYPNQYENGVVKKSFLKILLENANAAPTHKLTQPWFFKVYKGVSKDKLSEEMTYTHKVFKYVPYGNLYESVPYLTRRLYENVSILKHI